MDPDTYDTDRPWWTVDDAARLLRVNRKTLYDACRSGEFPCKRNGRYLVIPAEALRLKPRRQTRSRSYHVTDDLEQLELPLDPACLIPVRMFRHGGKIEPWHHEQSLWGGKVRRA